MKVKTVGEWFKGLTFSLFILLIVGSVVDPDNWIPHSWIARCLFVLMFVLLTILPGIVLMEVRAGIIKGSDSE